MDEFDDLTRFKMMDEFDKKEHFILFSKYVVVGIIFSLINVFLLWFITSIIGVYYIYSSIIAFFLANTGNFVMNKMWTFNEKFGHFIFRKYYKFIVINAFTLVLSLLLLIFFTEGLGIYYVISQLLALIPVNALRFWLNKNFTFNDYNSLRIKRIEKFKQGLKNYVNGLRTNQ